MKIRLLVSVALGLFLVGSAATAQPLPPAAEPTMCLAPPPMVGPPTPPVTPTVRPTVARPTAVRSPRPTPTRTATQPAPQPIVSPFGSMINSGLNNQNANGNMTGDAVGDAFGYGGLGAAGQGWGGGRTGEGTIGMGGIGTMGHGSGTGSGQGYGSGEGRGLRNRAMPSPLAATAVTPPAGPQASVMPLVEAHMLTVRRRCQLAELIRNPSAPANRVTLRFSVGPTGAVTGARLARGGPEHDPAFHNCVTDAVRTWTFQEQTGTVDYSYTFQLEPVPTSNRRTVSPSRPVANVSQ